MLKLNAVVSMMMFHTLMNVQSGEAVPLQRAIDNRDGHLSVALRQFTYTVGWYNVSGDEVISRRSGSGGAVTDVTVAPGLWNTKRLKQILSSVRCELDVNRSNGLVKLVVPDQHYVRVSDGLLNLLGMDDGKGGQWLSGTYIGDRSVNFSVTKNLHVHLDQLNTSTNFVGGKPSTLLATVGVNDAEFGCTTTESFQCSPLKRLGAGTHSELKFSVRDDNGRSIDNHSYPYTCVLEFRE